MEKLEKKPPSVLKNSRKVAGRLLSAVNELAMVKRHPLATN